MALDMATLGLRLDGSQMKAEAASSALALKGVDKAAKSVTRQMGLLGATLASAFTFRALIQEAGEFEGALQRSVSIMGDVSDVMRDRLAREAREVGIAFNIGATQAAESFFFLASAGLSAEQSLNSLGTVAQFAKAGMFDMATATDLATDAQSALGLVSESTAQNLENLTRVTDVLVKANTLANATVEQFSTSLTTEAGAALKSFGKDIEEGVAVLAAFADQGVKGQVAGTGLSRILRLVASGAVGNAEAYRKLNIEIFDSEGNMNNLADVIEDLERAFGGMSDAQRTASLEALGFQARVQGVILPLLGTSQAIREYEEGLRSAGGTTQEIADKQLLAPFERLGIAVKTFGDLSIDAGNAILRGLIPPLEFAAKNVDLLTDAAISLTAALGVAGLLKILPLVGAGLASLATFGAGLASTFVAISGSVGILGGVIGTLQIAIGPAGWLTLGVTALAGIFFAWRRATREVNEELEDTTSYLDDQRSALDQYSTETLRATQAQLNLNESRRIGAALDSSLSSEQRGANLDALEREREILADVNRLLAERATDEPTPDLGSDANDFERTLSALQRQAELQRQVNASFGEASTEIARLNLEYERQEALLKASEEFKGEELAQIRAVTNALFDQRAEAIALEEQRAREQSESQNATQIENLRRSVEEQEKLNQANREGVDAVNALRVAMSGEAAVRSLNADATEEQIRQARALGEEQEKARIAAEGLREAQAEAARAAADEQRAAEAIARQAREPFEEAARAIQELFSDSFKSLFDDGLQGFDDLADRVLTIFEDLASQIAALMTSRALGIDDLINSIRNGEQLSGNLGNLIKFGTGAVVGFGAGRSGGFGAGVLSGGIAGAATGGPVGALIGGISGAIGGLTSVFNQRSEEEARAREVMRRNNARLRELAQALDGTSGQDRADDLARALEGLVNWDPDTANIVEASESLRTSFAELQEIAEQYGITFDGSEDSVRALQTAIQLTIRELTTFGLSFDELAAKTDAYNQIFDVNVSPQKALEDTYRNLSIVAPELLREVGIQGLDLTTEAGRNALEQGLKDIFELVSSGNLANDPALLGAFGDKDELIGAMLRAKEGLNALAEEADRLDFDGLINRFDAYNKIFDVEVTPQKALEDTYRALGQIAPELLREAGLANLNLASEAGRRTLEEGLKDIFNLVTSTDFDQSLLGAFESRDELLGAILRVKDSFLELDNEVRNITTDFPRAADLVFYQQRFATDPDSLASLDDNPTIDPPTTDLDPLEFLRELDLRTSTSIENARISTETIDPIFENLSESLDDHFGELSSDLQRIADAIGGVQIPEPTFDVEVPAAEAPVVNLPEISVPAAEAPVVNLPEISLPEISVPAAEAPVVDLEGALPVEELRLLFGALFGDLSSTLTEILSQERLSAPRRPERTSALPAIPSAPSWRVDTVVIQTSKGETGEEVLSKIERAVRRRRALGGFVDLNTEAETVF